MVGYGSVLESTNEAFVSFVSYFNNFKNFLLDIISDVGAVYSNIIFAT